MALKTPTSGGLLKVIFLAHLVLSSWGMMSQFSVPNSYIYYNLIYMIALMWAIASSNSDSIVMAFLINCVIIIMDAFSLAFSWPRMRSTSERLYFGLAIANEVIRPITALLLYRVFKECDTENQGVRGVFADVLGESTGTGEAAASSGGGQSGYERISDDGQGESHQRCSASPYQGGTSGHQNV